MKGKIGLINILVIGLLGLMSLPAHAAEITINQTRTGVTTDLNHPASYLVDKQPDTFWKLKPEASQGWTELILDRPALIHGLKLDGYLGLDTVLTVEYQSGDEWLPFNAAEFKEISSNALIDLSWERVVTQTIRLRLQGNGAASSRFAEVELFGETASAVFHPLRSKKIISDNHTSPNAPAAFLSDGNTYTRWQTKSSSDSGQVIWEFSTQATIRNINLYFTEHLQGSVRLEILKGELWQGIATIASQPAGWYRQSLEGQDVSTDKVRLTASGGAAGRISEVQFWGYGDFSGDHRQPIGDQKAVLIASRGNATDKTITSGPLQILSSFVNTNPIINSLQHNVKLVNTGSQSIKLADVKLRYWYTNETKKPQTAQIYWSTIGSQNITAQFTTVDNRANCDTQLELGFKATAGVLNPGSVIEIKLGLNASDWSNYNQSDDYSFNGSSSYIENLKYTGYVAGALAWGAEPEDISEATKAALNLQFEKPMSDNLLGKAADGRLKVLYSSANSNPTLNSIQLNLKVLNTGFISLNLRDVKLRYWYTNETKQQQVANLYWSNIGAQKIMTSFGTLKDTGSADTYLELGFREGNLEPGDSVEIKLGFNAPNWSNYYQGDDYSFATNTSGYAENLKITGTISEQLAWGVEPGSQPFPGGNDRYQLELAFEGVLTESVMAELNGIPIEAKPGVILRGHTIYRCPISREQLWEGVNFLRIKPFTTDATLKNAFIVRLGSEGEPFIPAGALYDGLLFTETDIQSGEWQLEQPVLLEEATVTTLDNGYIRLFAWHNGQWAELLNRQNLLWGARFTGPVITDRLKLEASGTVGELQVRGSVATDQAPEVRIFWPQDGEELTLIGGAERELLGFVDNPHAMVAVNGNVMEITGHYFTAALSRLGLQSGTTTAVTATAKDSRGRQGIATVNVSLGQFTIGSLDQPDKLVYTDQGTFTISGFLNQPSQYRVNVNGEPLIVSGNRFLTTVVLQEGLNLVQTRFINAQNAIVKTFTRRVLRYSGDLRMTIQTPENGAYLGGQTVNVSGNIAGLEPLTVTVNGNPAAVSGGSFSATVSLNEGTNRLTVIAADATGKQAQESITLYRDTQKPEITGVTPAEGQIFATGTIEAGAQITDQSPIWVTINGRAVTANQNLFQTTLTLADGNQPITIAVQDAAGNMASQIVNVTVDTIAPDSFTPVADPAGWTNNNKPTISFGTVDGGSGIDRYQLSLDGGEWFLAVSPYQFSTSLSDGEHTVAVKAVDRAGNETTRTVKVYIDTTPPAAPTGFEVIPGIDRVIVKWGEIDLSGETVGYRIRRTPAFSGGAFRDIFRPAELEDLNWFSDEEVTPGLNYTYAIQSIDHAGNIGTSTASLTVKVGSIIETVNPSGGTVKFDNAELTFPEGVLSASNQVRIEEAGILPDNRYATKVGPAYRFTLLDGQGKKVQAKFDEPVSLKISYAGLNLPSGFTESDLGIYWYNKSGGYWEKLDYTVFDFAKETIAVNLHHFSEYQVMASKYVSPSLDSYYNMGVSPFQSYFQNNVETVSPTSGSLAISATDLSLPGRSGNGLIIQRIYDSAAAQQEKMIEANNENNRKTPVDTFGYGWSLNIPWIEQTDKGKFVRLPQGQTIKFFEAEEPDTWDEEEDPEPVTEGDFEYHEGIHFKLHFDLSGYYLTMNDGSRYEFDESGKATRYLDPSGKNMIKYEYNGRELSKIIQLVDEQAGAVLYTVQFFYQNITGAKKRLIERITVGDRTMRYHYDSSGMLKEVYDPINSDTLNRKTVYLYEAHTFRQGVKADDDEIFSYSVDLLNQIIYPTGEKSTYTYDLRDQKHTEMITIKSFFGLIKKKKEVGYEGTKSLIANKLTADKETKYFYEMNDKIGSLGNGNFIPAYTYMRSTQVREGERTLEYIFSQIEGTKLTNAPKNIENYKGPIAIETVTKIGNDREIERIFFDYDVLKRAITLQRLYRGDRIVSRVSTQYDDWGNIKYRLDESRNLEETWDYYNHSLFKNLPEKYTQKSYNPVKNTYSTVTTTYQYDESLGKPLTVTVNDGSENKVTRFTYDDKGNIKTKVDEYNDNLKTELFYDDRYQTYPVRQVIYGIRDVDGNAKDIVTETGYDFATGLKLWEKDPRGFITRYNYDKLNRILKVTLPDDDQDDSNNPYREYVFHDDLNRCELFNEKGQKTTYQFDGLGRLTEVIQDTALYPGGVKTSYRYNNLGQIDQVINSRGKATVYEYDGLNRVTKVTYPDGAFVTLSYDDVTNAVTVTDEEGGRVSERKDWAGRLVEASQYYTYGENNEIHTWSFVYDSLGNKLQSVDPLVNGTEQEYDAMGRVIRTILPAAALIPPRKNLPESYRPQLTYEYDTMGNRVAEVSANGNATGDPNYRVESKYDQLGRKIQITASVTDPVTGQKVTSVTKFYYDESGNKVKTVHPNNGVSEYKYSARGWLLTETDPTGNSTRYQYDVLGNKIAATDPRGNGTDGKFTTWYVYDDLNRRYRTVLPDNTSPANPALNPEDNPYIETTYDEAGNKIGERDANGVITTYEYTDRNWLWKVIDAKGRVQTEYTYDKKGNQIEAKDILSRTVKKAYDSLGRLRKVTDSLNNSEEYQYDAVGNKIAVTDARKNTTYFVYNSLGWQTEVRDALGNFTQYQYDPNGNPVETIAPNNLATKAKYDELNRVIENIDPLGHSVNYRYDIIGNRSWTRDRRGTEWTYQYYENNLLQRVEAVGADGAGYWAEYAYDEAGNRKTVNDNGNSISYNQEDGIYQADPLNRINRIDRRFDGAIYRTAYQYDKAGLVTGIRYPEAQSWLDYRYNDLNQLTEVTGFTAANGINYNIDGSLQGITYGNGVAAIYNYDINRRLNDLRVTLGGQQILNLHYTYDEVSNIKTITDNGKLKTYEYDKKNQLIKAVTPGNFIETAPTPGTASLKIGDTLGNGVIEFAPVLSGLMGLDYYASSIGIDFGAVVSSVKKVELVPDKNYSTHRINENTIGLYVSNDNMNYTLIPRSSWVYQKDKQGVVTLTVKQKIATRYLKLHVKYDERNRNFEPVNKATFLNEIARMLRVYQEAAVRTEEYQYDSAGNRSLSRVTLVQTAQFASAYYTNTDRLKTDGRYAFAYDNAGNMVKKGNAYTINGDTVTFATNGEGVEYWEYRYDLLDRLIRVTKNGTIVSEYGYDPEGLRVVKKANGATTHYVFQGTEPIFEKKIGTGKAKSYVYALGKYLARVDGAIGAPAAKQYYYHTDQIGSIRVITDQAGNVVFNADYLAFGARLANAGDFEELHGFTGKEYDPDIGLYYYNARWYDPDLGRFISEDPARDPNNPNLYSYCGNNSINRVDPTGEAWWILIAALLGGLDAHLNGGDFMEGFVRGGVMGAFGYGIGSALSNTAWGTALANSSQLGFNVVSGAIGGGIMGELFGEGFGKGAVFGAVSGAISYSMDKRFGEFSKKNWFNKRLVDGFKGGFNALARGGNLLEGFSYGFAYSFDSSDSRALDSSSNSLSNTGGPTLSEAADIAEHVYSGIEGEKIRGWRIIKLEIKGNLRMAVYAKRGADGTTRYVIANAGTDVTSIQGFAADMAENFKQPFGASPDMWSSIEFATDFVKNNPNANITFIGHSKGGAEAAVNAVATNRNAILFNPATINLSAYKLNSSTYTGTMTAYIVKGEALDVLYGYMSIPIDKVFYLPRQSWNPIVNHSMGAVKKAINKWQEQEGR